MSLLYLRPALVLVCAVLLVRPIGLDLSRINPLHWFLAALAVIIAAQLVPIPLSWWLTIGARAQYVDGAVLLPGFRPLTLTPDESWSSLFALLPPAAMLLALSGLSGQANRALVAPILLLILVSGALGIAQMSGGPNSILYLYAISHDMSPVGFLANRNHEAALLSMAIPIARLVFGGQDRTSSQGLRRIAAALVYLYLISMILATGSRAGLVMGAIGILGAVSLAPIRLGTAGLLAGRARWIALGGGLVGIAMIGAMLTLGRAVAVDRLLGVESYRDELRVQNLPTLIEIIKDFAMFGTGFGSFDPVFRGYERDTVLSSAYFNHAHNDYLELLMTGGVLAAGLLAAFAAWVTARAVAAYRASTHQPATRHARLGAIIWIIVAVGSAVDYPLRVPLIMVICTVAAVWLVKGVSRSRA